MKIETAYRPDGDTANATYDWPTVPPFDPQEGTPATTDPPMIHIDVDTQVGTGSGDASVKP